MVIQKLRRCLNNCSFKKTMPRTQERKDIDENEWQKH